MTNIYGYEKLFKSVRILVTGSRSIQDRLIDAFLHEFGLIRLEDLPKELHTDFKRIEDELTKVEPVRGEGSARATISQMDDHQANKMAQDIVELFAKLAEKTGQYL